MNLNDEITRMRKLITTRAPLDKSEATLILDALHRAVLTLHYIGYADTHAGSTDQLRNTAREFLREWGCVE